MASNEIKTAAGNIALISSARCDLRGGTTMFFGTLPDGRFVVASRFQVEVRTANRQKAEARFEELCHA